MILSARNVIFINLSSVLSQNPLPPGRKLGCFLGNEAHLWFPNGMHTNLEFFT